MKVENHKKVTDLQIAYIGGGSRGWAWGLMTDLAGEEDLSGKVRLYDIDFQAAKNNETIGNSLYSREDVLGKWQYEAVETIDEALTGADFVIISILPGTFDEMESDVHCPEKYGIYQSVGDTAGPGGIVRALRTIPMFVEIAQAIERCCPQAWVINYTNPMSLCVKTLYHVFPKIKAFGCCHEVFGTEGLLCACLRDAGIEISGREELTIGVTGINHFTWINYAAYKDIDVMPIYDKFVDKYYEEGFENGAPGSWMLNVGGSAQRVKFDLYKNFGLIAAAGDRHLAEFVPGKWYLKDPETVASWKFDLTPVSWRKKELTGRLAKSQRLLSGEEEIKIKKTGEEGVKQIKALLGLGNMTTNMNIPNRGQIQELPLGAIVETMAVLSKDKLRPVATDRMPDGVLNLVVKHVHNHDIVLEAALKKDFELAYAAFINDPNVEINHVEARALLREMLENTKKYLPGWKF